MSGHKPFKNLRDKLESTPEGRAAMERERRIVRDMLALYELRAARGVPRAVLDRAWETGRADVSPGEHETGAYYTALRDYVEALGGKLELRAVFPDQTIRLGPDGGEIDAPQQRSDQHIA